MKSKWIITSALLIVFVGIYSYYKFYVKPYMPKYVWDTNYLSNNDQPYGLIYFYKTLKSSSDNSVVNLNKSITRQLEKDRPEKKNYIFIGREFNATSDEISHLTHWVYQGNTAFLSTDYLSLDLLIELAGYDETEFEDTSYAFENKQIDIQFLDLAKSQKKYTFDYKMLKEKVSNNWGYFTPYELERIGNNHTIEILSKFNNNYPNFIKFRFGKGEFYLHSNPLVFTNYHFVKESGYQHAKTIMSYLPKADIYWDDINKRNLNLNQNDGSYDPSQSPLKYILSKISFRWAWYLLLILLILFVIFGSKRKQKPIKLVEENKNSSIEYAKAVAALYYQTKNHTYIANEMWRLFTNFVKIKYNIDMKNEKDEVVISLLSLKSNISENNINSLIKIKNEVCFNQGKDTVLLKDFQEILTNFYKNCN